MKTKTSTTMSTPLHEFINGRRNHVMPTHQRKSKRSTNDQFTAINVGAGDAFYLQRAAFSVLVDGGQASKFASRFHKVTGCRGANVVVCTHNDADHANGIVDFFESNFSADECWLPGRWLECLQSLLTEPEVVVSEIARHVNNTHEAEEASDEPTQDAEPIPVDVVSEILEQYADRSSAHDAMFPTIVSGPLLMVHVLPPMFSVTPTKSQRTLELIEAASNIRKIALAAARAGVKIRWFHPKEPQKPVRNHDLHVLNAGEVDYFRRSSKPARCLELTLMNRESLVLFAPSNDDSAAVLFCADSGLAGVNLPTLSESTLVTAPHHGSSDIENRKAYAHVTAAAQAAGDSLIWVRSDRALGPAASRPCLEFMSQRYRLCTNCRGNGGHGQHVRLAAREGTWTFGKNASCKCMPNKSVKPH